MGFESFDDLCNTGLVLGLGLITAATDHHEETPSTEAENQRPNKQSSNLVDENESDDHDNQPSLTLGLCGVHGYYQINSKKVEEGVDLCRQTASSHSDVSSFFSSGGVKRETKEFSCDEIEDEKVISARVSDEDEDGSNSRKKLRLTKEQSSLLEDRFKQHSTLNPKQKQALARQLSLRPRQVEVWFQNRRARTKLKQTEVDCEFLKKCCESLADENRRLHKELQELKALKFAQPMYMHMPAATLTICPSCERLGGVGDGATKIPFSMAPKPHFLNPFTNSSAAC